ncbi:MAG TPA: RagB/SusD family nutrient uptake outer membrane protein, partial [Flavisolibacter sp.]|nr:RagB/SusD family nutrient uptake outer membrane protein [Flavisolibacter sp.]
MRKYNIFFAALLLLGFTACKKDFLDVKPTHAGDSETAIQTAADAKVMINGLMSKMTSSAYYGRNFMVYGDLKGGDLTIFTQGWTFDAMYSFNHSKSSNNFSGFWNQIYHNILQTNNIIASIDRLKAAGTTENFDTYKGQALTARALMYFDLVRLYGKPYLQDKASYGVPNITEPLAASAQPLRATVEENYTQILKDLKEAEPLLSKAKSNGYLNYYANKAIQARVYLTMGNYPQALSAAEVIINDKVYKLYANTDWVNSWKSQFGTESIFELGIYPNESDLGTSSLGYLMRRRLHGGSSAVGSVM